MTSDPRDLGGDISGPGGPFDTDAVVMDTSRAILMDTLNVASATNPSDGRQFFALLVEGRINQSADRAKAMVIGDLDMLASFITEAHGLAERMGRGHELVELCEKRWTAMPHPPTPGDRR